jgi:predicted transcriptional regulator
MIDLSETEVQKTKRLECKGLIYRIKINAFLNKHNDYIYKESMIFQKKSLVRDVNTASQY